MSRARGINRERQVRKQLDDQGWWTCRAAGSFGDADIVAIRAGRWRNIEVYLIEVKSTAAGPYHGFGPQQRNELRVAAAKCGAEAFLVWWPPRKDPKWIHHSDWPTRGLDTGQVAV